MKLCKGIGVACVVLVAGAAWAAELKSSLQVGEKVSAFHPLNVNGKAAGQKQCLVCANGANPVAMVFARGPSAGLTDLVKKLDAAAAKNEDARLGTFVVFCSDDEKLEGQLKKLADKEGLKKCILSIDNPAGPEKMKVSKDADVTVVLYNKMTVKANHAFKKGELNAAAVNKVMADLAKILPEEKKKG